MNFVVNIFAVRASSKFQFADAAVSKIRSQTVTIQHKQMPGFSSHASFHFIYSTKLFSTFCVRFVKIVGPKRWQNAKRFC